MTTRCCAFWGYGDWPALDRFDQQLFDAAAPEGGWGPIATLRGVVGETARVEILAYEKMAPGASMATVLFDLGDDCSTSRGIAW